MLSSEQISKIQEVLSEYPFVHRAWLFGSFSRDEENANSDIDILYEREKNCRYGMFTLMSAIVKLEESTKRKVDLVSTSSIIPEAMEDAKKSKILIYEKK